MIMFCQVFVGSALLFVLSWRLALALLSALPIIAIAMVLQVCFAAPAQSSTFLMCSAGYGVFCL
jgi:hypothetical protein